MTHAIKTAKAVASQGNVFRAARVLKLHGYNLAAARIILAVKPKA